MNEQVLSRTPFITVLVSALGLATGASLALGGAWELLAVLTIAGLVVIACWEWLPVALALCVLAGNLILGYGFANVGIAIRLVSVPVSEIALILLLAWSYNRVSGRALRSVSLPLVLLLAVAALRLVLDLPEYGLTALRDSLTAWETLFLLVGYALFQRLGLSKFIRVLRWVFLACIGYAALYPWREQLAALGPVVGIQRPVPLLGVYAGVDTAVAAAFFFFALLRASKWSMVAAAGCLPLLLLFQTRGSYVAVPLATIAVLALSGRVSTKAKRALASAAVAGVVAGALVLPLAPQGRLGPTTAELLGSQAVTLLGGEGTGSGSITDRLSWATETLSLVRDEPFGLLTGVGFGPDLTGGYKITGGVAIRKPHNDYLELFARLGAVGLILFLWLLAAALSTVIRAARSSPDPRFLWWVVASVTVYLVIAGTQPLLSFPYGTVPLYAFLGAGLAHTDECSRSQE